MQSDEAEMRQLVSTWMAATKAGDADTVLSLIADDAVFLVAGRPPIHKREFAETARAQSGRGAPKVDGTSEIQEIKVFGTWAFMWSKLRVVVTPRDGSPAIERAGHTLTVLTKDNGKWVLARDANLLSPVQPPA
jgi:uncharacterized protein (TIGR02246 family)